MMQIIKLSHFLHIMVHNFYVQIHYMCYFNHNTFWRNAYYNCSPLGANNSATPTVRPYNCLNSCNLLFYWYKNGNFTSP
jgi:hypothetical protein